MRKFSINAMKPEISTVGALQLMLANDASPVVSIVPLKHVDRTDESKMDCPANVAFGSPFELHWLSVENVANPNDVPTEVCVQLTRAYPFNVCNVVESVAVNELHDDPSTAPLLTVKDDAVSAEHVSDSP